MVDTIRRSYNIFKQSLTLLAQDKEILIFPLLSGIFTILAFGTMVFGGLTSGFFQHLQTVDRSLEGNLLGYAALFVWYFISWFIVIFFNVAVVACAKIRLDGGDPTVSDGFRAASQHLGRIVTWALISATVGLILRVVAERGKLVGKIVSWIFGAAWSIATYFIVPVMIFEKRTLRESVRRSTELISKTWGESLVAAGGIGAFTMLLVLPGLALPFIGLAISPTAALIGVAAMMLYWIVLSVVSSALSSIFRTGLYIYASNGTAPKGYSAEFVQRAFAAKGSKPALGYRPA